MFRWMCVAALLGLSALGASAKDLQRAVVAGGCFWCVEADFDKVDGVKQTVSGYTGGHLEDPTYKDVVRGGSGHYEAVEITYDADVLSYETLVAHFLRTVDPTDAGGQFCDRGDSYRTAIFTRSDAETAVAEAEVAEAAKTLGVPIATAILPAAEFYPAESYHQDFYHKNPLRYASYRKGCRRDARIQQVWGAEAGGYGS